MIGLEPVETSIIRRRAQEYVRAQGRPPIIRSQTFQIPSLGAIGRNPLWRAAVEDDSEALQSLLVGDLPDASSRSGAITALVNAKSRTGDTLLTLAAKHNSRKCMEVLTRLGCDVNAQDASGRTAFFIACARNNVAIAKHLYHRAACDPDIVDDGGFTGFASALLFGNAEIVRWWLTRVSRSAATDEIPGLSNTASWSPFLLAVHLGHFEIVRTLSQYIGKVSMNAKDAEGRGALFLAAFGGRLELAEFILSLGIDRSQLTQPAAYGLTPLWVASCRGHLKFVRWLLEVTDADESIVNAVDSRGVTPLYVAVENDRVDVVECLTAHNADVNKTPYKTFSPAIQACARGNLSMLQTLMRTGQVYRNDAMMIEAARFNGFEDVVLWIQMTRGYFTALHYARELTFDQVLAHLRGADPRQSDIRSRIPIAYGELLGPSSLSLAQQCINTPLDDDRLELIRRAANELWSPKTHWLFDLKARTFAGFLARVGRWLACPSHLQESYRPLYLPYDIWSMYIMPMAISRTRFEPSREFHYGNHPNFNPFDS